MSSERIACFIVTGFLGSGKTTLLAQLLTDPAFHDSVVIVNELGTVGLDHDLVAFSAENIVVMPGGCVCCSIREDIEVQLRELFDARAAGTVPAFRRIIIETTGIAEPVPLLMTLRSNPLARERLLPPRVIAVVDNVLGRETLAAHEEACAQAAAADEIVFSKTDMEGDADLADAVRIINPWAPVQTAPMPGDKLASLFALDKPRREPLDRPGLPEARTERHAHHHGVRTHSIVLDAPLDWTGFGIWMTLLLHRHGKQILRVKGLLAVDGMPGPTLFQSAQHLVHPPRHMESWPSEDRRSRLVFIVRDLDPQWIARSLAAFDSAARRPLAERSAVKPAGSGGMVAGRPVRRATTPAWIRG